MTSLGQHSAVQTQTRPMPSLLDLVPPPSTRAPIAPPFPFLPLYPPVVVIKLGGAEALARSGPGHLGALCLRSHTQLWPESGWINPVLGAALRVAAFHFHSGGISVLPPLPGARWSAATSRSQVSYLFWISTAGVCAQRGQVLPLP